MNKNLSTPYPLLMELEKLLKLYDYDFLLKQRIPHIVLQGDGTNPEWIGSSEGGYFWRFYKDGQLEVNYEYCTEKLLIELRIILSTLVGFKIFTDKKEEENNE